jgi:integrase/recombinase XerC
MYHGAPKLDELITRQPGLRPRNVTATDAEKQTLLHGLPGHLHLMLLLCSDLAIRSGTASRIAPTHYDQARGILSFATKAGERLTLPTTSAIAEVLDTCDLESQTPFVMQVWMRINGGRKPDPMTRFPPFVQQFAVARRALGIHRKLTFHDFRRTTAVGMLRASGDVRDVQALLGHRTLASTIWYLDHDLRPVKRATLELIKTPNWRKDTKTA